MGKHSDRYHVGLAGRGFFIWRDQKQMRSDLSSTFSNRLFKQYGPLKTFSGKIDIAYAFSIIDAETYNELRAIKDIRKVRSCEPVYELERASRHA